MENRFLKNKKIKRSLRKDIEPHEILLDKFARQTEEKWGLSQKKIETPLLKRILQVFLLFSFFILLILFSRTFQFQVFQREDFLAQANTNKYILHKIEAERGVIYDQDLNQLVFNLPSFDLICRRENLPESEKAREELFIEVAHIIKGEPQLLKEKIEKGDDEVLIMENLAHESLIILESKKESLPGFETRHNLIREYKEGTTFAHLLGYMGKISKEELEEMPSCYSALDCIGKTGIENFYEDILREKPGEIRAERDALGNIVSQEVVSLPRSGKSLVLWLDSGLQQKIDQELRKQLQEIGAQKAVAVALDPSTGGVLSLVSIPSFNNNVFSQGSAEEKKEILKDPAEPLFNRAISGTYPTGSTIKPLVASAALEEGIVSPEKTINCQGVISVQHEYDPEIIYEYHDWNVHGFTDLKKAIAESCNVYFYTLGGGYQQYGIEGLGAERIKQYLQLFGWGEKTDIDIPSEKEGILPVLDENWRTGHTYHFSIGQGSFAVTPLQVVNSFAAIANGGKLLKPQVVKRIIDIQEGSVETLEEIKPEVIRQSFISPQNIEVVREGMRQAVTGKNSPLASAVFLSSLPVTAAAKTGTAETLRENYYHNWITVFAPYEDPEIVLTIMIEDVEGVRAATLPVAREVLNWYFSP